MTHHVVVLPGASSPTGSNRFEAVYSAIEQEARRRGFSYDLVTYPGQNGTSSGLLSYETALAAALIVCRKSRPTWVVARSFGCTVACGMLIREESWVATCSGVVLWGPFFKHAIEPKFGTREAMERTVSEYREYGVILADEFYATLPEQEVLIRQMCCSARLARGTRDKYNSGAELQKLRSAHQERENGFVVDVREVLGAEHEVVPAEVSADVVAEYYRCLYDPIPAKKNA